MVQVEEIAATLSGLGHRVTCLAASLPLRNFEESLQDENCDLVFNLVESVDGEGRLIHLVPALLDRMDLGYTGSPTSAIVLSSDKVWTKRLLLASGLPTPAWMSEDGKVEGAAEWPAEYIVKSVWEDASLGLDDTSVTLANSPRELGVQIASRRSSLGGEAFAESWIEGREFNLALLEGESGQPDLLPIAEMCFVDYPAHKRKLVGYAAKWDENSFDYGHTVRKFVEGASDQDLLDRLAEDARACWRLFGLRGYARVDFRVDGAGREWILEVNPNPCLSADAGFMAAAEQAGLTHSEVITQILLAARAQKNPKGLLLHRA
jgi:D-alanine-D-alanine ligase